MTEEHAARLTTDDVQRLDKVLRDTPVGSITRRALVGRAAAGAAAVSTLGPVASAVAQSSPSDSAATVINTAITAEALAVTYLSGLIQNASATGVTKFVDVLKAANAAEYDHYKALQGLGAKPLTLKFWAPDAIFKPGMVFPTLETAETLFIDAYLIGTTVFATAGQDSQARYAGEIAGVEAQHRALVRFAQNKLPNNHSFEDYSIKSMAGIIAALEKAGIGFGKQGATPGKFYMFAPPPPSTVTTIKNETPA